MFLTGHGDVPMSKEAMKDGAVDFLRKPVNDEFIVEFSAEYPESSF